MGPTDAKELLRKYKAGDCTEEEEAIVESWYLQQEAKGKDLDEDEITRALGRIAERLPVGMPVPKLVPVKPKRNWIKIAAGFMLLLSCSIGAYWYMQRRASEPYLAGQTGKPKPHHITLTLGDGKQVLLDSTQNGQIAQQGASVILQTQAGALRYQPTANASGKRSQVNSLNTPRGMRFELTLSDGTRVWLNAASSISYPAAFTGGTRDVEINGEAYFEVAKDKHKPFRVRTGNQVVEVLGTHFNIDGFGDDGGVIKTTLLEGSVAVKAGANVAMIRPGQQARTGAGNNFGKIVINEVDTQDVTAWMNGDLLFENQNIRTIMDKVSRMYDVDVAFEGKMPDENFGGAISHVQNVEEVLHVLRKTCNLNFKMEGRRITVMP